MSMDGFHPAVARWFRREFPAATAVQRRAWAAIGSGTHTRARLHTGLIRSDGYLGPVDRETIDTRQRTAAGTANPSIAGCGRAIEALTRQTEQEASS